MVGCLLELTSDAFGSQKNQVTFTRRYSSEKQAGLFRLFIMNYCATLEKRTHTQCWCWSCLIWTAHVLKMGAALWNDDATASPLQCTILYTQLKKIIFVYYYLCCCTRPGGHGERARSPTTHPPPHATTREQSRRHVTHVVEQAAR